MKQFFFIWDRTNNRLTDSAGNALDAGMFRWYRGDTFALCITAKRFNVATNQWEAEAIPATSTFQLMIKLGRFATAPQDGTVQLGFTDTDGFDASTDGVPHWAEAAAGTEKHSVICALTEAALATLLTVTSNPILPILEITEFLVGGLENTVEQQITIFPDINRGGSTLTTVPTFYTAAQTDAAIATALAALIGRAPGGDVWTMRNGEPERNLSNPGAPWS